MNAKHIQGITIFEQLTNLDPALISEAEVDARLLPPLTAADRYEHDRARREARRTRRETNPFFRFMGSGAGAVCVSLLVAFALIAGIVHFVNSGPGVPVVPGGQPTESLNEGKIPTGEITANYTIQTDKRVYDTSPKEIVLTATGKEAGVPIDYFQSARVESLTDPDAHFEFFWNDLYEERVDPLDKDEYDTRSKTIHINGTLPNGVYRIHHMEYDKEKSAYVSATTCDFAVGEEYGKLLGTEDTDADTQKTDIPSESREETDAQTEPRAETPPLKETMVSSNATLVINGTVIPCTDVKAQVVRIPEQYVGPVYYPSALSGRVPLLTVLRAIGAEVGEIQDHLVEITYKDRRYRLNLEIPSFTSEDEPSFNHLSGIPGTVDSYAEPIGDDVLVDAYSVAQILRRMDGYYTSHWRESISPNQIEFKGS